MKNKFLWIITGLLIVVVGVGACSGVKLPLASQIMASSPQLSSGAPVANPNSVIPTSTAAQSSIAMGQSPTEAPVVQPGGTQPTPSPIREVTVTGDGKVFLVPDVAYINIGVSSLAAKVKDALADNNTKSQAVKKALTDLGVADKDIQTSAFNIYPQPQYDSNGQITSTQFSVQNTVFVIVHDLTKLGQLLDAVVSAGANNIYGIQFDVQDKDKSQSDARKLAVDDAHKQATELATAVESTLGDAQIVTVGVVQAPVMYQSASRETVAEPSAATVPVSAGQLVLEVTVTITYELK